MKRVIILSILMAVLFFGSNVVSANALSIKLPYQKGQRFIVVQGYNTAPTHVGHDAYALDLSQNICEAYGKPVIAASAGTAMIVQEQGYNGGYGTELIINNGNDLITRYAHMIPGSIDLGIDASIKQGQIIGQVGDTGLVTGLACPDHPGTHLHIAMDIRANDGTLTAYKPEPISGYRSLAAGNWYLSDNGEEDSGVTADVIPELALGMSIALPVETTSTVATTTVSTTTITSSVAIPESMQTTLSAPSAPSGGVSVAPTIVPPSLNIAPSSDLSAPTSTTIIAPLSSSTLFEQLDDSAKSSWSWYDDNWFDLGSGFSGTLNTLTFEGKISDQAFYSSHVSLEEFKDPNYMAMIQSFDVSDNAPLTATMASATFTGLSIVLKPYFYYRLVTFQDYQNRSVILAGTSSTGTYMYNNFVYGVGRVESTSTFMPYMVMNGIAATSTLKPPSLTTPTNLAINFDPLNMQLNLTWSTSTDPDWIGNPLHYEINYSTSSILSDGDWEAGAQIPVTVGNSYLIGVRAADNFGDVSAVTTTTWNFPAGFEKYYISPLLSSASQEFTVPKTTALKSIEIFTTGLQTSARYLESVSCSLSLDDVYGTTISSTIPSDNGFNGGGCGGDLTFSFASSSPVLVSNDLYRWTFQAQTGNPSTQAWVEFYGTAENIAGGFFSDPSFPNARFVINGSSAIIFAN
jgi:hypothetical protein